MKLNEDKAMTSISRKNTAKIFLVLRSIVDSKVYKVGTKFRNELIIIGLFSAVVNILMLSPTLYMLQVFDKVMQSKSEVTLLVLTVVVLFFYIVQGLSDYIRGRIIIGMGLKFDKVVSLPIFNATFSERNIEKRTSPLQGFNDLMTVRQWLTGPILFTLFDLPWTLIYLIVMFLLHPVLGWITISFMFALLCFVFLSSYLLKNKSGVLQEDELALSAYTHAKMKNAEVVEALGLAANITNRWWSLYLKRLKNVNIFGQSNEIHNLTSKEIRVFMQSLALCAGAVLAIKGEISIGAMIAASLLMGRATAPIDQLVSGWSSIESVKGAFMRLEDLLKLGIEKGNGTEPTLAQKDEKISILLSNVRVLSSPQGKLILNDINTEFFPGTVTMVLGESSAGKSTLARTILGISEYIEGQILINGVDIRTISEPTFGKKIGFLPQEVQLFAGTVAENIARMQNPEPDKVVQAARQTDTESLILGLPNGYDSHIGEAGGTLSGGQKQRIALARAIYGEPNLIVLDEPNSNLDETGELSLNNAILKMKSRSATIIIITHKIEILDIADRVLVMSKGKIVQDMTVSEYRNYILKK